MITLPAIDLISLISQVGRSCLENHDIAAGFVPEGYAEGSRAYRFAVTGRPEVLVRVFSERDIPIQVALGQYDLGITRRKISDEEIVERLVFALVNEGAKILEEGIASKASDIDMVYLTGYGFPLFRGGPMLYADTVGLYNVAQTMHRYSKGYHGEAWKVAPLLQKLADEGEDDADGARRDQHRSGVVPGDGHQRVVLAVVGAGGGEGGRGGGPRLVGEQRILPVAGAEECFHDR